MKPQEKAWKIEKIAGYLLLAVGLVFIILPACLALWIFLNGAQVPQLVPVPATQETEFTKAMATFSNVCLIFFIFIVMVWAGSIVSTRGVTLVKDVKLKLVKKSLDEATDAIKQERKRKGLT
jgi:hypothetical protein